jgi:DNA-binding SARP family transcriptional activator
LVEFRLLGPLSVSSDGRELPLGGAKQRALLAILILRRNELVRAERLVEELWEEQPPVTARQTVQVYVSRLRKLLDDRALETRAGGYVLRIEPEALDVGRFESLLESGRRLLANDAPIEAREALRDARALWRGPPLADFQYDAFALAEIRRLEELRIVADELSLEAELALGGHAEAVGALEALVEEHPHRERLRQLQMRALYRAGRQAEALAAYQAAREALAEGLGLDPSPALQQLEQAILRQDAALDLTPSAATLVAQRAAAAPAREQRKPVTVLVAAVAVATAPGERLDAETRRRLLTSYLEQARLTIERHGGLAERYVGQALLAVFGLPAVHEDDALRALRAADELSAALERLNGELEHARLELRIGVESGEVVTGTGERLVTGEPVDVAVALQRSATAGHVLLGGETLALAGDAVTVEAVPRLGNGAAPACFRLRAVSNGAPGRRLDTAMVGRVHELEALERAFATVVRLRSCALVTLLGPAGVGKSRLAREFLGGVDARVIEGRCLSYGEGITYLPVVELVRQLGVTVEPSDPISSLLEPAAAPTTSSEIAWSVRRLLSDAAAERPLVVVLDDVHWAEATLLDLVQDVAELSRDAPIMLLCLARPELLDRHPRWGGRLNTVTLMLEPLGPEETDELIEHFLAGDSIDPSLLARLRAQAEGNPLFIEEMVALARGSDAPELVVPSTIKTLLAARLDQLEADERSVLECGAVEGQVFHSEVVETLAPAGAPVERVVAALARKDLIRPDRPRLPGGHAFRFRHLLIRDAAYGALTKAERADIHRRFGDWLAERRDVAEHGEIVGYHLEQAYRYRAELGEHDEALAAQAAWHLGASGARAAARADHHAATNLLDRAMRLLPGDSSERLDLLRRYSVAVDHVGRPLEAQAALEEIVGRAVALGDAVVTARARTQLAAHAIFGDPGVDFDEQLAILQGRYAALTEAGHQTALAENARYLGMVCRLKGDHADAAAWLERALAHATAGDDHVSLQQVTRSLAHVLVAGPMPVPAAAARCEELLEANRGDRVLEATISSCLAELGAMAGRFDEARARVDDANRVLGAADSLLAALAQTTIARALMLLGDGAGARQAHEARWQFFSSYANGAPDARAIDSAELALTFCCDTGRWNEAERWLALYADVPRRTHLRLMSEARVAAHRGEHETAVVLAERALELTAESDGLNDLAADWLGFAEVCRAAGHREDAEAAVANALAAYEAKGNVTAAAALRAQTRSEPAAAGV